MVTIERPLRGSRYSSFYPPPPADGPSLSDLDSAFQIQEYIALLIQRDPHDVDTIVSIPGRKGDSSGDKEGKIEPSVDEACWVYEQLRRLAQDLTHPLITTLQHECSRTTCPEMKAGEWLYLCVAHGDGAMEQCCAIDYIIHTLDSATALLNSPRVFPSRITIPPASVRHFSSLARRLGRIFAHAYFHHQEAFEAAEAENALYARFLALTTRFDLVQADFLIIPSRGAGDASAQAGTSSPPRGRTTTQGEKIEQPSSTEALAAQQRDLTGSEARERASIPHGTESPRRPGRARTDTMVFSDAAAVSEELARQGIFNHDRDREHDYEENEHELSDEPEGEDEKEHENDERDNNPSSSESTEKEKTESQPYTLTFSASGTMKGGWPPGVMQSAASSSREEGGGGGDTVGETIRLAPPPPLGGRIQNLDQSHERQREREEPTFELILPDIDHVQPLEYAHSLGSSRAPAEHTGDVEGEAEVGENAVEGGDGESEGGKTTWDQELDLDWGSDEHIAELIARKKIIDAAAARLEEREEVDSPDEDKEGERDEGGGERESGAEHPHSAEGGSAVSAKEEAAIASTISTAPTAGHEIHEVEPLPAKEGEHEEDQENKEKDDDVVDARSRTSSSGSSEFVIVSEFDSDTKTEEKSTVDHDSEVDVANTDTDKDMGDADADMTREEDLADVELALGH